MSDDNRLIPVNFEQIPTPIPTQIGTDDQFAEITKGGDYLGRLQLYTKSKANAKGLIPPGHYGIPESDEKIIDLGESVDLLPLARRPKAIDMSDSKALVISYDMHSKEFNRIASEADEGEPHRQFGISFLVYERSTGRFLEFFCGNKSSRIASKQLFPFLPLKQDDIDAKSKAGKDVSDLKPHGPVPMTLKVNLAENRHGSWHVPVVARCSIPFTCVPSEELLAAEITKFLTISDNGLEKATKGTTAK